MVYVSIPLLKVLKLVHTCPYSLAHLTPLFLGADPKHTLGAALDPLACRPCNVHLIVILLDRILVGLFPELVGGTGTGSPGPGNLPLSSEPHGTGFGGNDTTRRLNIVAAGGASVGMTDSGGGGDDSLVS